MPPVADQLAIMPSVADQLALVLKAPVLFLIALFVFWLAIWRIMEWRYQAVINKTQELFALSRKEIQHWKNAAVRSTSQAAEQVETLKKKDLPAEAKTVLDQLTRSTSRINSELAELGKASSASEDYSVGLWKPRAKIPTLLSQSAQSPPDIPPEGP